jgi:hypothetical protein
MCEGNSMNTIRDRDDLLTVLRPNTDRLWPAEQRDACLAHILANADAGAPAPVRASRLPRRTALVALTSLGVLGAAVGMAGAAGRLPELFTRPFSSWQQDVGVDPQTAVRVARIPGPDKLVLTVWVAKGSNGIVCVASGFESEQSAQSAAPTSFNANGATCAPAGRKAAFGEGMAINATERWHTFDTGAGDEVRAEVLLPDGTTLPVARVEGYFLGWYPTAHSGDAPQLIAFDAAGRSIRLPLRYL